MLQFPRNVWILVLSAPMTMSVSAVMVLAGSLLAKRIAPNPEWATFPLAALVVGLAGSVVPSVLFMKKYGRKAGHVLGILAAIMAALLAMTAAIYHLFVLLMLSAMLFGLSQAFVQQYRFAAIESLADPLKIPGVLSFLMMSGIVAAFMGPEFAIRGKDLFGSGADYAGSFLLLALANLLSLALMINFKNPKFEQVEDRGAARSLWEVITQPYFIVALLTAGLGYGLMSFLMTATPLSMHELDGIDLDHTKWVIQSHIIAMFAPSLVTGPAIRRFGVSSVILLGSVLYLAMLFVANQGHEILHYWWALVLLGLGWNALFLGGTTLLTQTYTPGERFKAQAFNDFSVFTIQAIASLSSGWVLFRSGWSQIIAIAAPCVLFIVCSSLWLAFHMRRGARGRIAA